jgi:hypothetical protein
MPLHRRLSQFCVAILAGAPVGALAQAAIIGEGRVKTDSGEFVTSGGRTWACLARMVFLPQRVSPSPSERFD